MNLLRLHIHPVHLHTRGFPHGVADVARDKAEHGTQLARASGFDATSRVACGKAWEAICEVAECVDLRKRPDEY